MFVDSALGFASGPLSTKSDRDYQSDNLSPADAASTSNNKSVQRDLGKSQSTIFVTSEIRQVLTFAYGTQKAAARGSTTWRICSGTIRQCTNSTWEVSSPNTSEYGVSSLES